MYGSINGQTVQTICAAKDSGVIVSLPGDNTALSLTGWTCSVLVAAYISPGEAGTPTIYSATPSGDGTAALWTLTGAEFTAPGLYVVELRAINGSNRRSSRVIVSVDPAFP